VEKVDSLGAVEREERGRLAELIVSCWAVVFGFGFMCGLGCWRCWVVVDGWWSMRVVCVEVSCVGASCRWFTVFLSSYI
jgi:hypothetical protein